MYCKRCGAPTGSDAQVCPSCARQQRPVRRKPKGFLYTVKGYMHMIILLMSVVALVFGLLNVLSVFNVVGIVSNDEVKETQYVTTEEMDEALKRMTICSVPSATPPVWAVSSPSPRIGWI